MDIGIETLYDINGKYILDNIDSLTFEELEEALYKIYLYCNPWHNTDQAQYYSYNSFNTSVNEWANHNFYKQHKAAKRYIEILDWIN